MHQTDYTINIKDGPIEHKTNFNLLTRCLIGNHTNHHLQKGPSKGNYNVIFLGADEWFNNNVVEIDNKDYCRDNKTEPICIN